MNLEVVIIKGKKALFGHWGPKVKGELITHHGYCALPTATLATGTYSLNQGKDNTFQIKGQSTISHTCCLPGTLK